MDAYVQAMGGPRMAADTVAVFFLYMALCSSPWWWSAWRAGRRRLCLPRRGLFSLGVSLLSYGTVCLLLLPAFLALNLLAEALVDAESAVLIAFGHAASGVTRFMRGWFFVWLPLAILAAGAVCTRRLARHWPAISRGLA